jgi:superfamily II DNA helicase RecQ
MSDDSAPAGDENTHLALFEALRDWRRQVAREHGVPAYTVFHDSTLEEIARRRPGSTEELRAVSGVGAVKLERYGVAVLGVVQGAQRQITAASVR